MLLMITTHCRSRGILCALKPLENSFQIHKFFVDLKFCISIVFDFSWDHCNTQEKLETMVMQKFGYIKVHYHLSGSCFYFILLALPDNKIYTIKKVFVYSQGYKRGHRNS